MADAAWAALEDDSLAAEPRCQPHHHRRRRTPSCPSRMPRGDPRLAVTCLLPRSGQRHVAAAHSAGSPAQRSLRSSPGSSSRSSAKLCAVPELRQLDRPVNLGSHDLGWRSPRAGRRRLVTTN